MFFPSADDTIETSDCILPETTVTFMYQATNLSEYVTEVDIQGSRGQPVSGSVTLKDRTGYLADFISSYNQTNSNIRAHNMTDTRKVSLTLTQGSSSIDYPDLVPGDPQWDNDATLIWNFTDYTPIINLDNQNIGDYLYSEGDLVDSDDVIDDIADHADQAIQPDFSPYDIGTFRANETNVLSAIAEISTPRQAYNKWIGDVLHLETLETHTSVMEIIDRFHIPRDGGLTGSLDTGNLRTRFNYFKDKPLASSLGRANCTGKLMEESQCVGRVVQINFNRPTKHAIVRIVSVNKGTIEDGVFYDEDGDPLPSPDWFHFYGPAEATSWLGTYYPDFEVGPEVAYVPSWEVYAVGGTLSPEEESFEVYKTISEVEAVYGARPEYRNMETELLRTEEDAQAFLDSLALEVVWSIRKFTLNTPFLIPGREGEFVGITHAKHELDSENCLINGWSHSYSIRDGWSNSYDLRALF